MNTTPYLLSCDLVAKYKLIEKETNDQKFYIRIAEYGKYLVDNSKYFAEIFESLEADRKRDSVGFEKYFKVYIDTWLVLAGDLLKIADTNGIKDNPDDPFSTDVRDIRAGLENPNRPDYWCDINHFHVPYIGLIETLKKAGLVELTYNRHFNGDRSELVLYPLYRRFEEEETLFVQIREISIWWAYYNISRLTFGIFPMDDGSKYFKKDNIVDDLYKFEFHQIATGNIQNLIILKKEKFKHWIRVLHDFIIPRVNQISSLEIVNEREEITEFIPFTFDKEKAVIRGFSEPVTFKKDNGTFAMVCMIMKKPKGFYYGDEVKNIVGDGYAEENKFRTSCYEYCRGICNRMAKVGVPGFLDFGYYHVRINPKYKLTK